MRGREEPSGKPERQKKLYPEHWDGVAGWLGFLVGSLIILGPILSIVTTAMELSDTERLYPWIQHNPLWDTAQIISWSSVGAYCLVSVYAGMRLLRRHVPSSVLIATISLWVAGPLLALAGLFALSKAGAEPNAADAGAALGRPIVWATVWTLYLTFSKRVRATYFGGETLKSRLSSGWRGTSRKTRQLVFLGVSWLVVSFLYFHVVAPLDPYPESSDVRRMWATILLPPLLLWVGAWSYRRFVGTED